MAIEHERPKLDGYLMSQTDSGKQILLREHRRGGITSIREQNNIIKLLSNIDGHNGIRVFVRSAGIDIYGPNVIPEELWSFGLTWTGPNTVTINSGFIDIDGKGSYAVAKESLTLAGADAYVVASLDLTTLTTDIEQFSAWPSIAQGEVLYFKLYHFTAVSTGNYKLVMAYRGSAINCINIMVT